MKGIIPVLALLCIVMAQMDNVYARMIVLLCGIAIYLIDTIDQLNRRRFNGPWVIHLMVIQEPIQNIPKARPVVGVGLEKDMD